MNPAAIALVAASLALGLEDPCSVTAPPPAAPAAVDPFAEFAQAPVAVVSRYLGHTNASANEQVRAYATSVVINSLAPEVATVGPGFTFEGKVLGVFTTQVTGSVPLYRCEYDTGRGISAQYLSLRDGCETTIQRQAVLGYVLPAIPGNAIIPGVLPIFRLFNGQFDHLLSQNGSEAPPGYTLNTGTSTGILAYGPIRALN